MHTPIYGSSTTFDILNCNKKRNGAFGASKTLDPMSDDKIFILFMRNVLYQPEMPKSISRCSFISAKNSF